MEILTNFLYQMLFTVGLVVLFGSVIAFCRWLFVRLLGMAGYRTLLCTGIIGTPVHELSHALMCLIFGHKITEIKLYDPSGNGGALGYVAHSYHKKNIYHQIGNFFIGIAPIVVGSGVLLLLMLIFIPDIQANVVNDIKASLVIFSGVADGNTISAYISLIWAIVKDIFSFSYFGNARWWVFFVLAVMISSHMELSPADIKGGARGFLYISAILLAVDVVVGLISKSALSAITSAMSFASLYIAGFLWLSAVFSVSLVVIALLLRGIKRLFGGR